MLLNAAKRADYDKLVAFVRSNDFQTKMSERTLRRPVNADAVMASSIPKRTLTELPFPGQASLISALLDNFLSDVRIPSSSRYVLDLSNPMHGECIDALKKAMLMRSSSAPIGSQRHARFQNREEVGIITFSTQPTRTVLVPMGSTPEHNSETRTAIAEFIRPLSANGNTAIYSAVEHALVELSRERRLENEKRYYTVVLMTDGINNRGLTHAGDAETLVTNGQFPRDKFSEKLAFRP
jgi:Ca-activated chloride channel homolog